MLYRDDADTGFGGNEPFGRKLASEGIYALNDIIPHLFVELKIGRCVVLVLNCVFHLVLLKSPILTIIV